MVYYYAYRWESGGRDSQAMGVGSLLGCFHLICMGKPSDVFVTLMSDLATGSSAVGIAMYSTKYHVSASSWLRSYQV